MASQQRHFPLRRLALAFCIAFLVAAAGIAPAQGQTRPSALDQIELRLSSPPLPDEDEAQALTVQLIAIKTRALECPAEQRSLAATRTPTPMPTATAVARGVSSAQAPSSADRLSARRKRCAADVEQAERLLGDLREARREALLARLSTEERSLPGLIRQVNQEPVPDLRSIHDTRTVLPPATVWGLIGLIVWLGLGLLTGQKIGRRVESAIDPDSALDRLDWRWPVWAGALCLAVYLAVLEHAASGPSAPDAWISRLIWIATALLTADRLLRLWSAPRLSGAESRPLNIMLAHRSGWLLFVFSLGQAFRLATAGQDDAVFDIVGLGLRSLALIAATALISVLLGAPFRRGGSHLRRRCLAVGLGALLILDWAGYHALVQFLLQGVAGSVVCFLVYATINRIADALFTGADAREQTVWGALGIRPLPGLRHAVWLRLILVLLTLLLLVAALMAVWGFGETARALLTDRLVNGFEIGGVRVIPSRFLNALGLLVAFLVVARLLRRGAFGRWLDNSQLDPGAREAILRTTEYGGLALAVLASFSWTGVGLQNTALIAGALSVGLGFGLQGLLANIVAGATLLLERSVRPGDWIEITGADGNRTQGRVKSVRARATEVQTLGHAEVIVPNADLVSRPLTNHTLRNTQGRIVLAFDLPHGLDAAEVITTLVRKVKAHGELQQDGAEAPVIQLRSIENERLRFELQASVTDFWKRQQVESDLNLMLYRAMSDLVETKNQPVAKLS